MTDGQQKLAFLKFIILLTLVAITHLLLTSCEKEEVYEPILNKEDFVSDVDQSIKDTLLPYYQPWEPDLDNGLPMHLLYSKEFGLQDTLDTIIHFWGFARYTTKWQEDGFPVEPWKDTTYSLLPDVPEPMFLEFTFKASGSKLD
jgi:hypothetical protein